MKRLILTLSISLGILTCYSQTQKHELSDSYNLTYKEIINLKLQILATQMTCGSYVIRDMVSINCPVSIYFNSDNKIVFDITKNVDQKFSKEIQKNTMVEGFIFVKTGISELIRTEFKELNFDFVDNIIGFWYFKNSPVPEANWENDKFTWTHDR
jgi:hypothetical protein